MAEMRYLDELIPESVEIGYGALGVRGKLGYEGKSVAVLRLHYEHALSTHPPARVRFHVQQQYASFTCQVALNDDAPPGVSHADFVVLADGHQVALEAHVQSGEPPRTLAADISGAEYLELRVRTNRWEHAHAVWLNPQISTVPVPQMRLFDCLSRAEMQLLPGMPQVERCIATVVSPGFEQLLDDMLGSLYANGGCQDAFLLVFVLDGTAACERVIAKYHATAIRCSARATVNSTSKSLLYSVARVINAQHYLCLDADMLILGDLRPIFAALEACVPTTILACREGNGQGWHGFRTLGHALRNIYGGSDADLAKLLPQLNGEGEYPLVVNDGLFAGSRTALLKLDSSIRSMAQASHWIDERRDIWWRNQFVFNLVLAQLHCGVELDPTYNIQLNSHDVQISAQGSRIHAIWFGQTVRVLHFNGSGRHKIPEWRGRFARIAQPLVAPGAGDSYATFLHALRTWVGLHGPEALAWSFYGTSDAQNARVGDPSTFPLLAALHYLIRSNGCVRVLETGTARGISAACLASAVAHRQGGRVVTIDPFVHPGRDELWATLPDPLRTCIEARCVDSLVGMQAALAAGESYEAALLDSVHTEEHVWAEFQLAQALVCPGGLILIHDAIYPQGTVAAALQRIEDAGYNVVRLWVAESGVAEDDRLGLALIENRLRHTPTESRANENNLDWNSCPC